MPSDRFLRLDTIFAAARALPPAERKRYLVDACGDDLVLRDEVASLLANAASDDGFLETPPAMRVESPAPRASLVGTSVGPYEVIALIGAGAMGEVYRARDPKLDRDVASKYYRQP